MVMYLTNYKVSMKRVIYDFTKKLEEVSPGCSRHAKSN